MGTSKLKLLCRQKTYDLIQYLSWRMTSRTPEFNWIGISTGENLKHVNLSITFNRISALLCASHWQRLQKLSIRPGHRPESRFVYLKVGQNVRLIGRWQKPTVNNLALPVAWRSWNTSAVCIKSSCWLTEHISLAWLRESADPGLAENPLSACQVQALVFIASLFI